MGQGWRDGLGRRSCRLRPTERTLRYDEAGIFGKVHFSGHILKGIFHVAWWPDTTARSLHTNIVTEEMRS
jgi:hypothetical protein